MHLCRHYSVVSWLAQSFQCLYVGDHRKKLSPLFLLRYKAVIFTIHSSSDSRRAKSKYSYLASWQKKSQWNPQQRSGLIHIRPEGRVVNFVTGWHQSFCLGCKSFSKFVRTWIISKQEVNPKQRKVEITYQIRY